MDTFIDFTLAVLKATFLFALTVVDVYLSIKLLELWNLI